MPTKRKSSEVCCVARALLPASLTIIKSVSTSVTLRNDLTSCGSPIPTKHHNTFPKCSLFSPCESPHFLLPEGTLQRQKKV